MVYEILREVCLIAATSVFVAFCGMCIAGMAKVIIDIVNELDKGE